MTTIVADDTDLETQPPSDTEGTNCGGCGEGSGSSSAGNSEVDSGLSVEERRILDKMEAINRSNESDTRSISGSGSRRSGESEADERWSVRSGSIGAGGGAESLPASSSGTLLHPQLSEEDVDLWSVWGHLVKNWETEYKKKPQYIRELVRRGIPCHFRTIAWQLLSGAQPEAVHEFYAEYMRSHSPHEKVIKRDISRTYPEHEFFKDCNGRGQMSLFNVMKAYSIHDREVGYCQGSAFIAGLLLLQMPEEEAFAVLLRLMEEFRLRELYKPAMTELGLCMFQLECLVQEQMPDLHMHFNNMGFDTSMYASSWFLTLFTTQLPLDLANRIMDAFISEGMEVVFRLAMAILQQCRFDLLQLDMEGMLRYFQREVGEKFENDHDLLMVTAYQVKLNPKKMKKLEKDYLAKRTKEQEEAVELRRLRTENRLLRGRIEYLEHESEALADRLIKGQVNLAQEAENCISVSHELHKLRDINADAHRRLEEAYETIRELSSKHRDGVKDEGIQVDDESMIEHIHSLQQQLIETNVREADNENTIRDLKLRIQELEVACKRLKETPPDHCVASLQEELISVKMREAEASLSLKEMRQRLSELENEWAKYVEERCVVENHESSVESAESAESKKKGERRRKSVAVVPEKASSKDLEDQLMGVRIRETDTLAELKEMRQKVMELETQNHVCTNQIRRQDEEYKKLRDDHDVLLLTEKNLLSQAKDAQHALGDAETKLKEQSVMGRVRESELLDMLAVLKNEMSNSKSAAKLMQKHLDASFKDSVFDDAEQTDTPGDRSMSNSVTSADRLSLGSETDFNAMVADMTVKIPNLDGPMDAGFVEDNEEDEEETETEEKAAPPKLKAVKNPAAPAKMNGGSRKFTGETEGNDSGLADVTENNNRVPKSEGAERQNCVPGPELVNGI